MKLCRVVGNITASVKHPAYRGQTLLIVQPLDEGGADTGDAYVAIDRVQAGPRDRVVVLTEGNGARQILKQGDVVPIRSVVVGIVDAVELT